MPTVLPITFALGPNEPKITPGDSRWHDLLPTSRHASGPQPAGSASGVGVTYGDYFSAARHFLEQDNGVLFHSALEKASEGELAADSVNSVAVNLVKHGAYYHPSCVVVETARRTVFFALNVAVSREGRKILPGEVRSLQRLNDELGPCYWPRVFCHGQGETLDGHAVPMFLGSWMKGYHEFHLTGTGHTASHTVAVWDADHGRRYLTMGQTRRLMRHAAFILAFAYHPLTFESVRSWHHAAGDFVVRLRDGELDVRLITVRDYSPFVDHPDPDMAAVLEALPPLLVATSLRLRTDRIDGTGPLADFPGAVVPDIWTGFKAGLRRGFAQRGYPDALYCAAIDFIALHNGDRLAEMAGDLVHRHPGTAAERDLLRRIRRDHAKRLAAAIAA
jgi:hypothetical protein